MSAIRRYVDLHTQEKRRKENERNEPKVGGLLEKQDNSVSRTKVRMAAYPWSIRLNLQSL